MIGIDIARSGLLASMTMANASASNIANVDTVGPPNGAGPAPYRPVAPASRTVAGGGVASSYTATGRPAIPRYDPGSPLSDGSGVVAAPDVDLVQEELRQVEAGSGFGANVAALRSSEDAQRTAIDLLA